MRNLTQNITAIVLAAGDGSRFGGDKLLHPLNIKDSQGNTQQRPMGLVSALNVQRHISKVICVVRPHDTQLINAFQAHQLTTVHNPDHTTGLASSIKVGVQAANPEHAIMVCLADMPFIQPTSYEAIIQSFYTHCATVCRPVFLHNTGSSQPGHPVIFAPELKNELMQLTQDKGAQTLLQSLPVQTIRLKDQGIIQDIDEREDLASVITPVKYQPQIPPQ